MSKKQKTAKGAKAGRAPKAKAGKKPTVAEAVTARKAEEAAAQAETAAGETTNATAEATTETAIPETAPVAELKTRGKKAKTPKAPKDAGPRKPKLRDDGTYSVLDAAHKVLSEAGTPLDSQTILERALAEGYWKTSGKTPQATIYAAIIREIAAKGDASRFKKVDRGQFATAK